MRFDNQAVTLTDFLSKNQTKLISIFAFCSILAINASAGMFVDKTSSLAPKLGGQIAAWGDFNNDGYVDINVGGDIWQNDAGKGFIKLGRYGKGGPWADYDNDGLLDIYSIYDKKIYRNIKTTSGTRFEPVVLPALPMAVSRGASWADYDNDGNIDLYIGGYEIWGSVRAYYDVVMLNKKGALSIKSKNNLQPARGVTSCDFDRDGDQDVYVSNYRLADNALYMNNGKGEFTDVANQRGVGGDGVGPKGWSGGHTIGSVWGDLDNDGYMDLFVGNFSHPPAWQDRPKFYKNLGQSGNYHFKDMSAIAKLAWQESYATPALGDYDNDGDLDLFFTTVYKCQAGTKVPNNAVLYRNDGDWHFTDVTKQEGLDNMGPTYQAAWADFDNDGDLDLVTNGKIFTNSGNSNHWLKVRIAGDGKTVNRAAIGTEVRIKLKDRTLTRQIEGGAGESGNQNDPALHFGLGKHDGYVDLDITAPNGEKWVLKRIPVDSTYSVKIPIANGIASADSLSR